MGIVSEFRFFMLTVIGLTMLCSVQAKATTASTLYRVDFSGVVDFGAASLFGATGNVFSGSLTYDASRITPVSNGPDPIVNTYNPYALTSWTLNLGIFDKPVVTGLPPLPYLLPLHAAGFSVGDDSQGHGLTVQAFGPTMALQGATQAYMGISFASGLFTQAGAVTWHGSGTPVEINLSDFFSACRGPAGESNCLDLKATIPNPQFASGAVSVIIQGHMTSWIQSQLPPPTAVPLPPAFVLFASATSFCLMPLCKRNV